MFGSNEDISVMKINTHGGQDAFVYLLQKNPYFFEFDKIIFPTGLSSISCLQWLQYRAGGHCFKLLQEVWGKVTICPGSSRTVLYFRDLSWN